MKESALHKLYVRGFKIARKHLLERQDHLLANVSRASLTKLERELQNSPSTAKEQATLAQDLWDGTITRKEYNHVLRSWRITPRLFNKLFA